MVFMWVLMVIVLVAVVCTAREIVKGWKPAAQNSAVVVRSPRYRPLASNSFARPGTHTAKWLSISDCERLVHSSDKVIFIAIGSSRGSFPFPEFTSICIPPYELEDVLRWIPPGQTVVLCGQIDLCLSTVRLEELNAGTAQIYVLRTHPAHSMVG
jgi:hypothetical protein